MINSTLLSFGPLLAGIVCIIIGASAKQRHKRKFVLSVSPTARPLHFAPARRSARTARPTWLALATIAVIILIARTSPRAFAQGNGSPENEGPVGVTGVFNGNITTAGSYDPLTHNAKRTVTDIVVPGSIGKYPLRMTRYYNSRLQDRFPGMSPGWNHEYGWILRGAGGSSPKLIYPNGNVFDTQCGPPVGVSEYWESGPTYDGQYYSGTFRLADGGKVHFSQSKVDYILDPYQQSSGPRTTLAYDGYGRLSTVTEPGGRYLLFIYYASAPYLGMLQTVEAHDGQGHTTDSVSYSYSSVSSGGQNPIWSNMLTGVTYSDSPPATYVYGPDNVPDHPYAPDFIEPMFPLLSSSSDVRYNGPMRQIAYVYEGGGPHGTIVNEDNPSVGHISTIGPGVPLRTVVGWMQTTFTETRGDGPTRSFTYTPFYNYFNGENDVCLNYENNTSYGRPPQQMLLSYTDFAPGGQVHTTYLGYDNNWFVNSVQDANNHTTTYLRGSTIGEIQKITHPDNTYIQYSYTDAQNGDDPHYVMGIRNERGYWTNHTRDANRRITRTDYPDGTYETFNYNGRGQVLTHRMSNGAYQHFYYDSRGRLQAKTIPTWNSTYMAGPDITYTYYTSGPWTDRVLTMTLPANCSNLSASETYEYDRVLANGVTDPNGAPVAGRGLVTKITYADQNFKSFGYDAYGNKVSETNELGNKTSYAYDSYNRLTSVTDPLVHTTTYSYEATNGSQNLNALLHTTASVHLVTPPTGIATENRYDENFRKISTKVGSGTPAFYGYDNVGNPTKATDPRGSQLGDSTYTTITGYDSRNRKTSFQEPPVNGNTYITSWVYGDNINVTEIDRPDTTKEIKSYDSMNRIVSDSVPRSGPTDLITTTFHYYPASGAPAYGQMAGQLYYVTDGLSHSTLFEYDPSSRKTKMKYTDYDPNLHPNEYQQWTYDAVGNLCSRHAVDQTVQSFTYDIRNRPTQMRWLNDNNDWSDFTYWPDSRLHTATNENSAITRLYDGAGRMYFERQSLVGLPYGNKDVNLRYDNDNKKARVFMTGYDYTLTYDGQDRFWKIWQTSPSALFFQYSYDPASNETQRYNWINHIAQNYVPDNLDRITRRDVIHGQTTISSEAYGLDSMNRLTYVYRAEDGKHDSFGYQQDGELYSAQYGSVGPQSPYQGGTQDSGASDPSSQPPGTAPDSNTYGSDGVGNPLPPDSSTPKGFTPQSDMTNPGYTPGADLSGVEAGQPPAGDDPDSGSGMTPPDSPDSYARIVTYNLNKAGNRTGANGVVDNNVATSYTPNILNQYTGVGGTNNVTNGLEHEISLYQGVSYAYIHDTHLKTASSSGNTYTLAYDALGRCVKRTLNTDTTYYVYDGEEPISEWKATDGSTAAWNVYGKGIDEILMRVDVANSQTFYYQQDHEGSVTHLTNGGGGVVESYRYDVFGAPTMYDANGNPIDHSTFKNRFLFTGREYAATPAYTGTYVAAFAFYEYRARAYHPGLGRFMSEDPKLFDAGDYNLYRYCHNDPEDLTDPMGLTDIPMSSELIQQIYQASLNSLNESNMKRDGLGRGQLVQHKIDANGKINYELKKEFFIGKAVWKPREEYQKYHTGEPKKLVMEEGGKGGYKADPGYKRDGIGHAHLDVTGKPARGEPKFSDADKDAARGDSKHVGTPVGRIDESNPGVFHLLVPQVERTEPRPVDFTLKDVNIQPR